MESRPKLHTDRYRRQPIDCRQSGRASLPIPTQSTPDENFARGYGPDSADVYPIKGDNRDYCASSRRSATHIDWAAEAWACHLLSIAQSAESLAGPAWRLWSVLSPAMSLRSCSCPLRDAPHDRCWSPVRKSSVGRPEAVEIRNGPHAARCSPGCTPVAAKPGTDWTRTKQHGPAFGPGWHIPPAELKPIHQNNRLKRNRQQELCSYPDDTANRAETQTFSGNP